MMPLVISCGAALLYWKAEGGGLRELAAFVPTTVGWIDAACMVKVYVRPANKVSGGELLTKNPGEFVGGTPLIS